MRHQNFAEIDAFINQHNAADKDSKVGHNYMSDWTPQERSAIFKYKTTA